VRFTRGCEEYDRVILHLLYGFPYGFILPDFSQPVILEAVIGTNGLGMNIRDIPPPNRSIAGWAIRLIMGNLMPGEPI
jgi:hypothetical protein